MSNPFEGKSLTELRDGASGLSNAEIDALVACVDGGEWVRWYDSERFILYRIPKREGWYFFNGKIWIHLDDYSPTTDWREAGRLLVKYRISSLAPVSEIGLWLARQEPTRSWKIGAEAQCTATDPRRAIAEAAAIAGLTQMIEGGGDVNIAGTWRI